MRNPAKKTGGLRPIYSLLPLFFLIVQACGDDRPDTQFVRAGQPEGIKTEESLNTGEQITAVLSKEGPLASENIFSALEKHSEKAGRQPLTEFFMSGSTGHLPENIGAVFEGLGLAGSSDSLNLTTTFGLLPAGLQWEAVGQPVSLQLTETANREVLHELSLKYNNIPIHSARLKTIRDHDTDSPTYLTGSIPRWLMSGNNQVPRISEFALSVSALKSKAAEQLNFALWRFHSSSQVYVPSDDGSLEAAYLLTVSAEEPSNGRGPHVPLEVAVSADTGTILWQRPLAMHAVSGEALLYVENRGSTDTPTAVPLPDLLNDGKKLSHPLFDIYNCHQRARFLETGNGAVCDQVTHANSNGDFKDKTYSSEVYDELISYAATTKAMNWFRNLDFASFRSAWDETRWKGTRANFGLQPSGSAGGNETRLKIFVRTRTAVNTANLCGENSTPDNAQYLWSGTSGSGIPEILIGYGGYDSAGRNTCYRLRDLGKDMDVIMHEFGHHIVFRGLSNAKPQSVAMHEGFSDYFTYAISGNNLLAEYSAPPARALRQGNIAAGTTFKTFRSKAGGGYTTVAEDVLKAPHLVGEFWSGILWEIRGTMGSDASTGAYKLDKIVWDTIDLLKAEAGLHEGIVALSESAKRNALRLGEDPAQAKKIVQDAFVKYGFARYTAGGELAAISELAPDGTAVTDTPVTTKTKTKKWGCGDVAYAQSAGLKQSSRSYAELLFLIILLLLPPLATVLPPAAGRIAVRVRKKRRRN